MFAHPNNEINTKKNEQTKKQRRPIKRRTEKAKQEGLEESQFVSRQ